MTTTPTMVPSKTIYDMQEPYGDVKYADPGYRDGRKRYPIDTEAHVRAALAYINMPKNAAKYSAEQLEMIKGRIHAAAKKLGIEVAEKQESKAGMGMARPDVALLAGAAPVAPPASWFSNPGLQTPTKLTITEDGRVFGHLATWRTCHIGIGNSCVMAPRTRTDYGLFRIGSVICEDGSQLSIGKLVMGSAHANAQWGVMPARDFYDNSAMTAAIVNIGEDQHGIWFSGALASDMTPEKIASLRACAVSGDWRTINGNMELIAALAVNSPGFPIYKTSAGRAFSLQAIGVIGFGDEEESGDNMSEFSAPPTGVETDEDQEERLRRFNEITEEWDQHQQDQRFAQLAALDEERDAIADYRPRTYTAENSAAIRSEFDGPPIRWIDDELDKRYGNAQAAPQEEEEKPASRTISKKVKK